MARSRNIKPGFFANEHLASLPFSTRLLFIGLWTLADREGRLEDRPKRIKMALFPLDEIDIVASLDALASDQGGKCLRRYSVNEKNYIEIVSFKKHQSPHSNEAASDLPPPPNPEGEKTSKNPRKNGKRSTCHQDEQHLPPRLEALRSDSLSSDSLSSDSLNTEFNNQHFQPSDAFEQFWNAYPVGRKQGKGAARKAWERAIVLADPQTIIQAATEYASSPVGRGQFVKGPAPWLNQECWNDDRAAWQRKDDSNGKQFQPGPGQRYDGSELGPV